MLSIRSILVVIEPTAETDTQQSPALNRACQLAAVTGAHLHLLVCANAPEDEGLLHALKADVLADDCSVSAAQAWNGSVHRTVVEALRQEHCDLVIKQHRSDHPLKKALLTPDDWKLLRECPAPVLMVKGSRSWAEGVVLAAVDVGNPDAEHQSLHYEILHYGREIARVENGQLRAVAAFPAPALASAEPGLIEETSTQARYEEACEQFCDQFELPREHLLLEAGPADVLIPSIAQRYQAVLAVLGTVARGGLSGALIGNTAEVVLDSLECDVLVLKSEELEARLEQA